MNSSEEFESWSPGGLDPLLADLQEQYLPNLTRLDVPGLLRDRRLGHMALVSSFGTESIVLIHYVVNILPRIPVLFLDTEKHFPETLHYRDRVAELLDLNLITISPQTQLISQEDPQGCLYASEPNTCCAIRKTFPLQDALQSYDSWISGRKRYQGGARAAIPLIERDGVKIKVNPMAIWTLNEVAAYFDRYDLPRHPLEAQGYRSIGCKPCTRAVAVGEEMRVGRWADLPEKSECGIHLGPDGRFNRHDRHIKDRNDRCDG